MATKPRPPRRRVTVPVRAVVGGVAAVALLSGIVGASVVASGQKTQTAELRLTRASAPETTTTERRTTLSTLSLPTTSAPPRLVAVSVVDGLLQSNLALARIPQDADGEVVDTAVWLLSDRDSKRYRAAVNSSPALHPLVLAGANVYFSGDGGYKVISPSDSTPRHLDGVDYLIPRVGEVDSVDGPKLGAIDPATAKAPAVMSIPATVQSIFLAVDGGYLVMPTDLRRLGQVAFWAPGDDPQLFLPTERAWSLVAAAGSTAVVILDRRQLGIVDLASNTVTRSVTLAKPISNSVRSCISPDGARVAVASAGDVAIVNLLEGREETRFTGVSEGWSVAWTSPTQLAVVSAPGRAQRTIDVIEVQNSNRRVAAYLDGSSYDEWWITSATPC